MKRLLVFTCKSRTTFWDKKQEKSSFLIEKKKVSCTVTFDPKTEGQQLKRALEYFQYQLKGISMLPSMKGVYEQMPYEEISEEKYQELASKLKPVEWNNSLKQDEAVPDKFCDASSCTFEP